MYNDVFTCTYPPEWVCYGGFVEGENMPGRPRRLTPTVKKRLIEGIGLGMTNKLATQYAGISEACFYKWRDRANDGDKELIELFKSLKRAEAKHAGHALAVIKKAANEGTWSAAAWLLERRHAFRRDAPPVQPAATMEVKETETIDPTTKAGREAIVSTISELPEEIILAALNRRSSTALAK